MRFRRPWLALVLAFSLTGCTRRPGSDDWQIGSFFYVTHGQVDFTDPPNFEWSFGSYKSVMFFDHMTVIRMDSTYYDIAFPPSALLAVCVAVIVFFIALVWRLRKRQMTERAA